MLSHHPEQYHDVLAGEYFHLIANSYLDVAKSVCAHMDRI